MKAEDIGIIGSTIFWGFLILQGAIELIVMVTGNDWWILFIAKPCILFESLGVCLIIAARRIEKKEKMSNKRRKFDEYGQYASQQEAGKPQPILKRRLQIINQLRPVMEKARKKMKEDKEE